MSTLALALRVAPARAPRPLRLVIARHVEGRARLWALIWGAVFGIEVLAQAKGFAALYPTAVSRLKMASSLQAYAVLVGPARHTETVAGFTVWKVLVFCAVIAGIWGVRASVGLLRGQEEAGQWELLLSGPITKRLATAQALLGLGAVVGEMYLLTLAFILLAGSLPGVHFSVAGSVLFALTLVAPGALFLAIGALASQLRAQRGEATTLGMLILGASYLVSMVANSRTAFGWLRWFTPIGWIEEVNPFRDTQPLALALLAGLTAVCVFFTLALAGRRDLLQGVLPERELGQEVSGWLTGPTSLALKLNLSPALAWLSGLAIFGTVFGLLTRSTAAIYSSTPQLATVLAKLGAHRVSMAFLGTMFLMYSVEISVLAASQVAAIRDEEASGRLDNLLVQPVRRLHWLASRIFVALGLLALVAFTVAFFTWVGAASTHSGVGLSQCLQAGLNIVPPGVFVLGSSILVFGLWPRLTSVAGYGIVGYSFLMEILGSFVKGNDWLKDSSLFSHVALAPAATPDWGQAAIILALGIAAAALGAAAFQRRDLVSA